LGTSIYAGTPSKTMANFCKNNGNILKQKRLALFVCGMEQDAVKQQQELANATKHGLSRLAYRLKICSDCQLFSQKNDKLLG
jgi:menaquinone-dependent protoporphyrinogen oxidase